MNLQKQVWFIWLFPLVFYLIGLGEYSRYIRLSDCLLPYLFFTAIVWIIERIINRFRAYATLSILFFIFLLFYSFFADIKNALLTVAPFVSSYPVLLLVFLSGLILLFFLIRHKEHIQNAIFRYLNYLTLLLIIIQIIKISGNTYKPQPLTVNQVKLKSIQAQSKPNMYLILLDGYPGKYALQYYFNFDNSSFLEHLKSKNFQVIDSSISNYNITIASMNSILNMQYLQPAALRPWNNYELFLKSFASIESNKLCSFLAQQGYTIQNQSLFDLAQHRTPYYAARFKKGIGLLHAKFFHEKIKKDLIWMLCVGKFKVEQIFQSHTLHLHHQNKQIIQHTINVARNPSSPQFTYAHVLLPHQPFFTDSNGIIQDVLYQEAHKFEPALHVSYQKYTNKLISEMIDSIVHDDPGSIIVLMSDHGYREYPDSLRHLIYHNLLSVRFPHGQQHFSFGQIHSNVNVFRYILNEYYQQHLPLLPDSMFYVNEEKNQFMFTPRNMQ